LRVGAQLRVTFSDPAQVDKGPDLVRLGSGARHPRIICFPSTSVWASNQELMGLAVPLRGVRDVWSLMAPGFVAGEPVADSLDTLTEYCARQIRRSTGDAPFALAGRSSGGSLACAVTARLEEMGSRPLGLVLIDSYLSGSDETEYILPVMEGHALELEKGFGRMTGTRLTAMGAYFYMFENWRPTEIATPTLLVRASECFGVEPGQPQPPGERWQPSWPRPHEAIDVPGNHYSMIEVHGDATAAAIHDWLVER